MTRQTTSPSGFPYYQATDAPDGAAQQQDLANTLQTFVTNRAPGMRYLGQTTLQGGPLLTTTGATLVTLAATLITPAAAGDILVSWQGNFSNANSGADRTCAISVFVDGSASIPAMTWALPLLTPANTSPYFGGFTHRGGPSLAAGAHTWTLTASASANASVQANYVSLSLWQILS